MLKISSVTQIRKVNSNYIYSFTLSGCQVASSRSNVAKFSYLEKLIQICLSKPPPEYSIDYVKFCIANLTETIKNLKQLNEI